MNPKSSSNPEDRNATGENQAGAPIGEEADSALVADDLLVAWLVEATGGEVTTEGGPEAFQRNLDLWFDQNEDKVVPVCGMLRTKILEEGKKHGVTEAVDFPESVQIMLHEVVLMLAGTVMRAVHERIQKQLSKLKRDQQTAFLDQAVADLGVAEEYLLDATEPERSEWLALVRPLRAKCHRKAEELRRLPPRRFPFSR